ncbi:hypothetical protein DL96DRAFT_1668795 [Flagelloscypha sp. PMI_526]|nr:hypothetical protein DL96DRAFT_1668795 [Flagelloscypha sp. PMI_526]
MSLLVLSQNDVEKIIQSFSSDFLVSLMARVFRLVSQPQEDPPTYFNPARLSFPTSAHTTLFMPARIAFGPSYLAGTTCKIVSVPRSPMDQGGLPGSTLVLDETSGAVKAIVNSRSLTALRNAAGSLLSATLCIPSTHPLKRAVMFGTGAQIDAHIHLFCRSYSSSIIKCTIVARSLNERAKTLETKVQAAFPTIEFKFLDSNWEDDLKEADLIICATPSKTPLFPSTLVRSGTHVILIGSYKPDMHEVDTVLINRAVASSGLIVDSWEACSIEAGELILAGVTEKDVKEIGEMVSFNEQDELQQISAATVKVQPVSYDGPVTIFKSVGVGLQDTAITVAVVSQAEAIGVGFKVHDFD